MSLAFGACAPPAAARGPEPLAWSGAVLCAGIFRGLLDAAGSQLAGCRAGAEALWGREMLRAVLATASAGTCLTCAVAASPLCIAVVVPLGILLRRSARYGQAGAGALADPKTGLLNMAG